MLETAYRYCLTSGVHAVLFVIWVSPQLHPLHNCCKISIKNLSLFPCFIPSVMLNKLTSEALFLGHRQTTGSYGQIQYRQTIDTPETIRYRQRRQRESGELKFHLLLVEIIQEEAVCYLIVTLTHFSISDVILNTLNQLRYASFDNKQMLCPFKSLDHKLIAYQIGILKLLLNCYHYHRNKTKCKAKELSQLALTT